eukprot:Hpha_TRINITY_DN3288_c0_g1::TRINITY_DN3288_c0_g1_i1::g.186083::m.186083
MKGEISVVLAVAAVAAAEVGWLEDEVAENDLAGCRFASVDVGGLTAESFETDLRHRAPLLLRGSVSLEMLREDTRTRTRTAALFRKTSPGLRLRTRTVNSVEGRALRSERGDREAADLIEYLDTLNESALEFSVSGHHFADVLRSARRGWPEPALSEAFGTADASTLGIWPPWAGAPVHAHEETYFALLHGAKLWLLWPPGALEALSPFPDPLWPLQAKPATLLGRIEELPPAAQPMRCLQRAGEIMYLPDFWWHATINVGETLGFGQQKLSPSLDVVERYPDSCKTAGVKARQEGHMRRSVEELRRVFGAAPWCLMADKHLELWGETELKHGGTLRELIPAVAKAAEGLRRLARDGVSSTAQVTKDMRQMAKELLDLLPRLSTGAGTFVSAAVGLLERARAMRQADGLDGDPHALAELAYALSLRASIQPANTARASHAAALRAAQDAIATLQALADPSPDQVTLLRDLQEELPGLQQRGTHADEL